MTECGCHRGRAEQSNRTCVLLLKAPKEDEEDPYINILEEAGFDATVVPVLSFRFVNQKELGAALQHYERLSGVVFTSPRAVQAISKAISCMPDDEAVFDPSLLRCFVVGHATADAAQALGFKTEGAEAGSGKNLAELIISTGNSNDTRPLLYPCANIRREALLQLLHDANCKTKEIVVYETCASETLDEDIKLLIETKGIPEIVVFFSPSGVQFTAHLIKRGMIPLQKIKVCALGPSTHQALLSQGYEVSGVASKPDPASLLKLLQEVDRKNSI
ncbi:uroporphyrinogen-III synthase-like [Pomacea canaliculata]|uniref:uroporphyrinogen-III synthase-like n=1 Tax=Pomacea canaliculata TaxID=400727 RepID=UPI000D730E3A|nr:uroporphyrinogen-III synthase-like [Pomacea canaliculata]